MAFQVRSSRSYIPYRRISNTLFINMEIRLSRALAATASQSARYQCLYHSRALRSLRCLQTSSTLEATPVPHPSVPGPPPTAPQASISHPPERVARKREKAELFLKNQQAKPNPAKPISALQKRFWKNVSVKDTDEGLQIHLDTRPVRTATRQALVIPHNKRALATAIAVEWDQLATAQQALKQHYIPMTSLVSRAVDISTADEKEDSSVRESIVKMLMRYLSTDTLLCWAPEFNMHDPEHMGKINLRQKQREVAEPIIAHLKTHIFPGVDIVPILGSESIVPTPQPETTREVIRGWVSGLPAYELAALERGVLATKSLLVGVRLLVEWSHEFSHLRKDGANGVKFDIEDAAEAATLEVMHQIKQWGEVEDTHDVEREDLRRQLGSVVLLVS